MSHPFDLSISELEAIDLEFEEQLTVEQANNVGGGIFATTLALGEEGGDYHPPIIIEPIYPRPPIKWPPDCELPIKPPIKRPIKPPIKPPIYTTLAIGEEGGDEWLI